MNKFYRYTLICALTLLVWCGAYSKNMDNTESFRLLQQNIWLDASQVDNGPKKLVDMIIQSKADFITLSEVKNKEGDFTGEIVDLLGEEGYTYYYSNPDSKRDTALISKYPITESYAFTPEDAGEMFLSGFEVEVEDKKLLIFSLHLDYTHYALYSPRGYSGTTWGMIDEDGDGKPDAPTATVDEILAYNKESIRDEGIKHTLDFYNSLKEKNHYDGVIIAGDFNDGSHLDWTEETKDMFDHNGYVIPWNNTITLEENGFVDSYRFLYPDPTTHPGITWPAVATDHGSTSWAHLSDERDRIDFVFYKGDITPTKGYIAGPKEVYVNNEVHQNEFKDNFLLSDMPWPTDHRGVIIDFDFNK